MSKLQSIAPGFGEYWNDPENLFRADDGSFTFHGMFVEFSHYVREEFELLDEATRVQLFQFAEECAAHRQRSDTELSNAVYTCFIENLTNEPISAQIRSYLGPKSLALFDAWDNPLVPTPPNEALLQSKAGAALCNCGALRAPPFTASLLEPLQQNAALGGDRLSDSLRNGSRFRTNASS